jgi:hypothetical protein
MEVNFIQATTKFQAISPYYSPMVNVPAPYSGNDIYYTAHAYFAVERNPQNTFVNLPSFKDYFNKIWDGVLYRTPTKEFGPDNHDNYLGSVVGSYLLNDISTIRKILFTAIKKMFVLDGVFLGQYVHVWFLAISMCIPLAKWFMFPLNLIVWLTQKPHHPSQGASPLLLQMMVCNGLDLLYPRLKLYQRWKNKLLQFCGGEQDVFLEYTKRKEHPLVQIWTKQ